MPIVERSGEARNWESLIRGAEAFLRYLPTPSEGAANPIVHVQQADLPGVICALRLGIAEMEKLK